MRFHRSPAVCLLLAGAVLLAAERWRAAYLAAPAIAHPSILVTPRQLDDAERAFVASQGRAADADERRAFVEAEVDDEILYREALAHGLDRDDPVVQRRLLTNMEFVAGEAQVPGSEDAALYDDALALGMARADLVVRRRLIARMRALLEQDARRPEPTDDELEQALVQRPARFVLPSRVRLAHVTLRGAGASQRAQTALAGLDASDLASRDAVPPADGGAPARIDELALQSERDLARLFGAAFARAVFALPAGRWSGPLASTHGQHLVWVHEHEPARAPALAAVRNQVREAVLRERAADAVRQALHDLRARYEISIGAPTPGVAG